MRGDGDMLTADNLTYITKTRDAFTYSFEGGDSRIIGVAGLASSGKSLLLSLLGGRLNCAEGKILLKGKAVERSYLKKMTSVFPHKETVFDDTPREQVLHSHNGVVSGFVEKSLVLFFKDADIPRYALCESQQKIADIMQAASGAKEILILDNPDASLDAVQTPLLASFIRDYSITLRKLTLIASHNVTFLANCCDSIIFLKNRSVAAHSAPENISEEMLTDVYGVAVSIAADISTGKPRINFEST